MSLKKRVVRYYKKQVEKIIGEPFEFYRLENLNKLLYGTFGFHDSEPPHSIITRKVSELENSSFSLWGATLYENGFEKVREFCYGIKGDVYLLLAFTDSDKQVKSDKDEDLYRIWNIEEVLRRGNFFRKYIDEMGEVRSLEMKEPPIVVKGNKRQKYAFVVEKYLYLNSAFNRKNFLGCYSGRECDSNREHDVIGTALNTISPCYLLNKIAAAINGKQSDDRWAIVLKLRSPFVVECLE